ENQDRKIQDQKHLFQIQFCQKIEAHAHVACYDTRGDIYTSLSSFFNSFSLIINSRKRSTFSTDSPSTREASFAACIFSIVSKPAAFISSIFLIDKSEIDSVLPNTSSVIMFTEVPKVFIRGFSAFPF